MADFITYVDELIAQFQDEEQILITSDRKDEANFAKIKTNICEICKTLYSVSAKRASGEALKEEYLRQLTRLPENRKLSYEKAKEHNDIAKMVIEEVKLEVLNNIKEKYMEVAAEAVE